MKHLLDAMTIQADEVKSTGKSMLDLKQEILDKVNKKLD